MSIPFPSRIGPSDKNVHFAVERKHFKFGFADAALLGMIMVSVVGVVYRWL